MSDSKERLQGLDRAPVPDVWDDAVSRAETRERSGSHPGRKLVTIGVAFIVFAAAAAVTWRAFDRSSPVTPGPATPGQPAALTFSPHEGWQARSGYPAGAVGPVLEAATYDLWPRDGLTSDFYATTNRSLDAGSIAFRVQEVVAPRAVCADWRL